MGLTLSAAVVLGGCVQQKPAGVVASSSGEPNYALRYPDELESSLRRAEDRLKESRQLSGRLASFPEMVKEAKKEQALAVVERADEAGRSYAYVERAREAEQVQAFFKEEKDEINKKVGGAVQFAVKPKGASFDAFGVVSHSLGEAIEKQSEKRLRERNEAHAIIERYRASLSKNAATNLEKLADEVSLASYICFVEAPSQRQIAQGMVGEAPTVKRTADDFIQKEKAFQAEAGRTAPEKKASEERIAAMIKSRDRVDAAVEKAKQALPGIDQQIKDTQREHNEAVASLKSRLK